MHALPLSDDMVTLDAARGVVHYSFFAEAEGNDAALEEAIVQHRAHYLAVKFGTGVLEPAVVPTLPRRRIDRRTFFGEFYDMDRDALLELGAGTTDDGRRHADPSYDELGRAHIKSWRRHVPDAGSGGNYAYAFAQPTYPLAIPRLEVQALFRRINALILPGGSGEIITDWSSRRLGELSEYFRAGLDYWGRIPLHHFPPVHRAPSRPQRLNHGLSPCTASFSRLPLPPPCPRWRR